MSAEGHRAWEEELAAYALDALAQPEREAVDAHLAECERCRGDLRWIRAAVETLPAAVEPRTPPARLRRRLLGAVRREVGAAVDRRDRARVAKGRRVGRVLRPALALAAVAALAVGGALGYLARGSGEVAETTVTVQATGEAPAVAEATLARSGESGTLRVTGLPRPRGGGVYQVWIRNGTTISPSTVFVVDRDGVGVAAVPGGLEGADEVMVTREPPGGSEQPTTAPLLRAPLS